MENYWTVIREANEKKYQDQKDEERSRKINQLPGWKVIIIIILVDALTAIERTKRAMKNNVRY